MYLSLYIYSSSCICDSLFLPLFFTLLSTLFYLFPRKFNKRCQHFYHRKLPPQPTAASLFVKFIYLSFMLNIRPNFIKGAGSAKMPHSFAAFQTLMERSFFVFSAFLFLLIESQWYFMFFLKLLMNRSRKQII